MKKAALYVRVSSDDQRRNGMSVENQIDALQQFVKDNPEYQYVGLYNDAGHSAHKSYTTRPALISLLSDCKAGKIDTILFTKLDRWFRSVPDYYEVQTILNRYDIKWRAIWEDYETETSTGVFKVNIMLSVAQNEADKVHDRALESIAYRKSIGQRVAGRPPIGYKIENKALVIDETIKSSVEELFDRYESNRNVSEVCREFNETHSDMKMDVQTFYRMVRNPVYSGNIGGYYQSEAYMTPERQKALMNIKPQRTPKDKTNVYLFSGLVYCADCGAKMSPHPMTSRGIKYIYYRCPQVKKDWIAEGNHHKNNIKDERKIEEHLLENLDQILGEYAISLENGVTPEGYRKGLEKKRDALTNKLRRIGDRYEDGDYTKEEYKKKRKALEEEIQAINDELVAELNKPTAAPELPHNWKDLYNEMDKKFKKLFWGDILDRIEVREGTITDIFFK